MHSWTITTPRFIVTTLPAHQYPAQALYEQHYCGRGEMESRIKEQQLWPFADRTSSYSLATNLMRLYFCSLAYTLLANLRSNYLAGTALACATCQTIRLRFLRLGVHLRINVRRFYLSFSCASSDATLFSVSSSQSESCAHVVFSKRPPVDMV